MPQIEIFLSDDNKIVHDLTEEKISVGRLPDNLIENASVSSHHAEFVLQGDTYHLHDLGSTNGTFLNGEQVTDAIIKNGDELRFGQIECVFASGEIDDKDAQPLPESVTTTVETTAKSARPPNFTSTSPTPKGAGEKDPLRVALFALAAVAFVAFLAAAGMALTMQVA